MLQIKQSTAVVHIVFLMVDSTDHVTGKTGLSPTVTISKNAGSFASPSGAITEIAHGWYKLAANATDTNTLGALALHATGTGADPTDMICANIVLYDPQAVLSTLDAAGVRSAVGMASANLDTQLGTIDDFLDTEVAAIKAKTDSLTFTAAGMVDANVIDWKSSTAPAMTGDAFARLGAPAGVSVSADVAAVKADTAATLDDTGTSGVVVAAASKTGYRLSSTGVDDVLRTELTEGYATDGATFTLEQAMYMVWSLLAERAIAGTTLTAKKLNGSTAAMTFTLDDAVTPTSQTRAT
jgi:hypothetical protein